MVSWQIGKLCASCFVSRARLTAIRIGRKPTFILAYIGILFAFGWAPLMLGVVKTTNLYLAMLGSLFFLIGGGIPVAMNSLTAMAADVSSEAEKYSLPSHSEALSSADRPETDPRAFSTSLSVRLLGPWLVP